MKHCLSSCFNQSPWQNTQLFSLSYKLHPIFWQNYIQVLTTFLFLQLPPWSKPPISLPCIHSLYPCFHNYSPKGYFVHLSYYGIPLVKSPPFTYLFLQQIFIHSPFIHWFLHQMYLHGRHSFRCVMSITEQSRSDAFLHKLTFKQGRNTVNDKYNGKHKLYFLLEILWRIVKVGQGKKDAECQAVSGARGSRQLQY